MIEYSIEYYDKGRIPDFSKKDSTIKAAGLDNLRARLIKDHVYYVPRTNILSVYDGLIRISNAKNGKYLGTLIFNQKDGRAYWMKPGEWDFYYPLSAKTGRISGEGMDYFRKPKIVKKRRN